MRFTTLKKPKIFGTCKQSITVFVFFFVKKYKELVDNRCDTFRVTNKGL